MVAFNNSPVFVWLGTVVRSECICYFVLLFKLYLQFPAAVLILFINTNIEMNVVFVGRHVMTSVVYIFVL